MAVKKFPRPVSAARRVPPAPAPPADKAPSEDPVSALLALGHAFRSIENALGSAGPWLSLDLTMGQLKAVVLVVHTGGVRGKALADHLATTPSAITPLVDRLIEQKLVRRESDPDDRRVIWIRPTARAMALHQTLMHTRRPVLEKVWQHVPSELRSSIHKSLELLLDAAEQALQSLSTPSSPKED